jgi:uncharacterized RDD family membrane protein YckC
MHTGDDTAGRQVKCPACGTAVTIPAVGSAVPPPLVPPAANSPIGGPFANPYPSPAPVPMNYALWADRVIAALVDGVIVFGAMVALWLLVLIFGSLFTGLSAAAGGGLRGDAPSGVAAAGSCTTCCILIILPPLSYLIIGLLNKVYLVSTRGYSVGQGLMKLRVVDSQGNFISIGTALIRLLATVGLGFVPIVGGFLDLLWPLWDPHRQTLHDKAVDTFVIKIV